MNSIHKYSHVLCLLAAMSVFGLAARVQSVAGGNCEDECPKNNLCSGTDVDCPECLGFFLDCTDHTALEYNPANIVIRKKVPTGQFTGETAVLQDEIICWRSAQCTYGAPLIGQQCSGIAQKCLSGLPYLYCTPCGPFTGWTDHTTNDYMCVAIGCGT